MLALFHGGSWMLSSAKTGSEQIELRSPLVQCSVSAFALGPISLSSRLRTFAIFA